MKSWRAFTLIELLVVIAIIAILAALLLPVLSKAKNQASKATDLNNLKEIMVAVHIYASNGGDVLPSANWDDGGGNLPGWLYTPGGATNFDITTGQLWPLLHDQRVYVCPSDNLQMWHWSNHDQANEQRAQQLSSYAINGAVVGYSYGYEHTVGPVKLGQMQPGDCAFWETDETEPYYFNDGANFPPEGVSGRHEAGGIQAAFDGSISYIKTNIWYLDIANTNKSRLWCNPNSPDGRGTPGYPMD
ncbi:MAG TPA: prepilin-type N-terminal cleavage/methylation domain-containing protein [Verrucomicrobiae bacterium]|nr:prepilin-type N-terminal cleavage/methylation domain-containing protein [Verrucomicrobiae bacterium]